MTKKRRKNKDSTNTCEASCHDMEGDFAYIAGYTSGGAPYGVRWEDVGIDSDLPFEEKIRLYMDQIHDQADVLSLDDVEELPFD